MYLYFESNMMFIKNKENSFTHSSLEWLFLSRGWEEKRTADTGFCSTGVGFQEVARLHAYTHVCM